MHIWKEENNLPYGHALQGVPQRPDSNFFGTYLVCKNGMGRGSCTSEELCKVVNKFIYRPVFVGNTIKNRIFRVFSDFSRIPPESSGNSMQASEKVEAGYQVVDRYCRRFLFLKRRFAQRNAHRHPLAAQQYGGANIGVLAQNVFLAKSH